MIYTKLSTLFMRIFLSSAFISLAVWWSIGSYVITSYLSNLIVPVAKENPGTTYALLGIFLIGTTYCDNCKNIKFLK